MIDYDDMVILPKAIHTVSELTTELNKHASGKAALEDFPALAAALNDSLMIS